MLKIHSKRNSCAYPEARLHVVTSMKGPGPKIPRKKEIKWRCLPLSPAGRLNPSETFPSWHAVKELCQNMNLRALGGLVVAVKASSNLRNGKMSRETHGDVGRQRMVGKKNKQRTCPLVHQDRSPAVTDDSWEQPWSWTGNAANLARFCGQEKRSHTPQGSCRIPVAQGMHTNLWKWPVSRQDPSGQATLHSIRPRGASDQDGAAMCAEPMQVPVKPFPPYIPGIIHVAPWLSKLGENAKHLERPPIKKLLKGNTNN